jgi:NAD(P)-dependent dehydrogenase (short-subunit alcohol dehydrogenase family)
VSDRPVALVTGASRGIGKAGAIDLAAAGYDVAVAARTRHEGEGRSDTDGAALPGGLDTTVAAIEAHGAAALSIRMDLLDRASVDAAVAATVDRFGRLDVLVNNAIYQGRGVMAPFDELTDGDLHDLFEGNVFAQLAAIRAALPRLLERPRPTIVNMISATAYQDPPAKIGEGGWGMGYAMTKAAFGRVAPLLHVEYRDAGLRVFSLDPGFTITERMEATGATGQYAQHFAGARPEVIGRAIRWLVTDDDADELRGQVVIAQREVKRRGLLPGWPPPEPNAP